MNRDTADGYHNPIARAQAALREGRAWEARDRMAGRLAHAPADQQVLDLLARAWAELGDAARAGRYWYLTAVNTPEAEAAREAFRGSHHDDAVDMAYALKVRAPLDSWPEPVQQRLQALAADVEAAGLRWELGRLPRVIVEPHDDGSRWDVLVVPRVLLATVGVWIVGVVALVVLVVS